MRPTRLVCGGCGVEVPAQTPVVWACPAATPGDDTDHVLRRVLDPAVVAAERAEAEPSANPFVRYRCRFHSYHVARAAGWTDERYVALVEELDTAVAGVDGSGFRITPLVRSAGLDAELGMTAGGVWVKDETGNVSGSHKARHLMGVMLSLRVAESMGLADPETPLAIASCGNAALAAAVVARAAERRLRVFVPPSAEKAVVDRLRALGAELEVCERQPGESGDPTVARLLQAIAEGAVPFTVQGNLNGLAIEGGQTLAWELLDQLAREDAVIDRLVIHVGGGAFASSAAAALEESVAFGQLEALPVIDTVQTAGGYPLARAYERVAGQLGAIIGEPVPIEAVDHALEVVARHRSHYMWAWETEPVSIAHGILDDETYDWLAVVRAMLITGGRSVVVDEATLEAANALARPLVGIDADHTGTAGLAGLIQLTRDGIVRPDESVAVIFSGARRGADADTSH